MRKQNLKIENHEVSGYVFGIIRKIPVIRDHRYYAHERYVIT